MRRRIKASKGDGSLSAQAAQPNVTGRAPTVCMVGTTTAALVVPASTKAASTSTSYYTSPPSF